MAEQADKDDDNSMALLRLLVDDETDDETPASKLLGFPVC